MWAGECFIAPHTGQSSHQYSSTVSFYIDLWWCRYGRVWYRQWRL